MNKQGMILVALGVLFAAQWILPLTAAGGKEETLEKGVRYRFRVAPIDPYDPFRGRYVVLNFRDDVFITTDSSLAGNQELYVVLEKNESDYAVIKYLSTEKPESGDYFSARVRYENRFAQRDSLRITMDFPFYKYYMNEDKAPLAERQLRDATLSDSLECWANVRVYEGEVALEGVQIDGKDIEEWVTDGAEPSE